MPVRWAVLEVAVKWGRRPAGPSASELTVTPDVGTPAPSKDMVLEIIGVLFAEICCALLRN